MHDCAPTHLLRGFLQRTLRLQRLLLRTLRVLLCLLQARVT